MWPRIDRRLLGAVVSLVRAWWRVDRIRVSVREGALLRLQPPCVLRVAGRLVEVRHRRVAQTPVGPLVVYRCATESGAGALHVERTGSLRWVEGGKEILLAGDDVEAFGAAVKGQQ